jgi:hypothetical protein
MLRHHEHRASEQLAPPVYDAAGLDRVQRRPPQAIITNHELDRLRQVIGRDKTSCRELMLMNIDRCDLQSSR